MCRHRSHSISIQLKNDISSYYPIFVIQDANVIVSPSSAIAQVLEAVAMILIE